MKARLRPPHPSKCAGLTELCLRSKAHWGYDKRFMAACRAELTLTTLELSPRRCAVLEHGDALVGFVQIAVDLPTADLTKLFVAPAAMGHGYGAHLFAWAADAARQHGADVLTIEADPQAGPFYTRMGAIQVGQAPSGSIAGRMLPLLEYDLTDLAA